MPSDTDNSPGGSSAGSTAATAEGLAALTVGLETSTDTAQMIAPAGHRGRRRAEADASASCRPTGVLGVAKSQDAIGPIDARRVGDRRRRRSSALTGHRRYRATSTARWRARRSASRRPPTAPYPAVLDRADRRGRDDRDQDGSGRAGDAEHRHVRVQARPRRLPRRARPGVNTLQGIINYNAANPVEGLKYQQGQLVGARSSPDLLDLRVGPRHRQGGERRGDRRAAHRRRRDGRPERRRPGRASPTAPAIRS